MERFFLEFGLRTSLVVLTTATVLRVYRIRSAAAQHAAWAGVVIAMLALPAWMAWGPKASVPVLPAAISQSAVDVDTSELPRLVMPEIPDVPLATKAAVWNWNGVFLGIYFLGAITLLLRLAIGTIRANRLTSESCAAPVTVGLLRPRIILPASSSEWSQEQLDAVLTHEREHARRRDPLFQWLALFNRAVFWFHPLAWWLERKLSALAEEACDAAVLERGHDPREYSRYLLELARDVKRAGTRVNVVAMAMPGSYLPQRVKQIIEGVRAPRISRARMVCAGFACAIPAAVFAAGTLDYMPRLLKLPLPALSAPSWTPQGPPVLMAQATAPTKASEAKLEFEVSSVRPVAPVSLDGPYVLGVLRGGPGTSDPGRVTYSRVGLRGLLTLAYGVQRYQVIGPDWLDSERYDVNATIRPEATKEDVNAMVQNLLTERFHVSLHHETRDMPVYELTVGKGGPKGLRASVEDSSPLPVTPEPPRSDKNGLPQPTPGRPSIVMTMQGMVVHLTARTQSLAAVSKFLTDRVRVPVVDKTGLMGTYDFVLDFAPEVQVASAGPAGAAGVPSQDDGPSIYVALEQQLGLRLEQRKGSVDVLVVDHADKVPLEN